MTASPGARQTAKPRLLLAGSSDDEHNRLQKLVRTYRGAGYQVSFVGMDRRGRRPRHSTVEGAPCEYLTRGWGYSNWRLLIGYPIWIFKLFLYTLRARVELIHAFELDSALPVALATAFTRIPFLYDVQDNYDLRHPWPFPLKHIIRRVDSWVLARARGVIVPDENRIVGPFQPFREKTVVIPNCPPDVPPPANLSPRQGLTVLAMGYLSQRRGIGLLLDAVAETPGTRVLMAGSFTDAAVEARARALSQVEVHGWVPWHEAISLGYRADVVFAFYDPAFAINLLANAQKWFDAMMTGTPVLSNREIANADWIEREDFGYLCPYGDPKALQQVLGRIRDNPEEARRKGGRGRRLFEEEFNWPLMEKKLLRLAGQAAKGGASAQEPEGALQSPHRPRVFTVVENYLPGSKGGGTLHTISNTVEKLGCDYDFRIVCRDRDFGERLPYPDVNPGVWNSQGRAKVLHSSSLPLRRLKRLIREAEPDLFLLNSLFGSWTIGVLLLRRLGQLPRRPVILAPRGSFSPAALRSKGFKKKVFLFLARLINLYGDLIWQASSRLEHDDILRQMGADCRVYVAPDLATLATPLPLPRRSAKVSGRVRFVHLSRIAPQKNLLFALNLLPDLQGEVILDIYGPREDDSYWEKCQRALETLPPHAKVAYRGSVPHAEVPRVFAQYDFFVFPTVGESFGHVTLEALAQGCPVVLSDQTPWRNLEQHKVGWDLPLDRRQDWVRTLQHCVDMGPEEFQELSGNAQQFTSDWLASSQPVEHTHGLLKFAMESGAAVLH